MICILALYCYFFVYAYYFCNSSLQWPFYTALLCLYLSFGFSVMHWCKSLLWDYQEEDGVIGWQIRLAVVALSPSNFFRSSTLMMIYSMRKVEFITAMGGRVGACFIQSLRILFWIIQSTINFSLHDYVKFLNPCTSLSNTTTEVTQKSCAAPLGVCLM